MSTLYTLAGETLVTQHWLSVTGKSKIYPDYTLSKSKTMLNPGKYLIVAEGDNYYQLGDSLYVKRDKGMTTFKVITNPESSTSDTIDQHRQNVDQMIHDKSFVSPYIYLFFALVLVVMILAFFIN
ncbi:MAG: hypothetical protein KBA26_06660 [Candidatus Delongbacteria bacterium]|nr:hypothetical protein [Candidatus Delongbacteria bacterium]